MEQRFRFDPVAVAIGLRRRDELGVGPQRRRDENDFRLGRCVPKDRSRRRPRIGLVEYMIKFLREGEIQTPACRDVLVQHAAQEQGDEFALVLAAVKVSLPVERRAAV
jgi:hypothetical protein